METAPDHCNFHNEFTEGCPHCVQAKAAADAMHDEPQGNGDDGDEKPKRKHR